MSFQELCEKYKKEICPYCINKDNYECNICKTKDGVRCYAYVSRHKEERKWRPIENWQRW